LGVFKDFGITGGVNLGENAYSSAKLPPNPDESCHSFHFKAATDSGEVCHPLEV
jgi:hypothetical protein